MMKLHKHGRFTWAVDRSAVDCVLVILLRWENKGFRIDYGRTEPHEGWWRTVTKVKAWRNDPYGAYSITHYYFRTTFVH